MSRTALTALSLAHPFESILRAHYATTGGYVDQLCVLAIDTKRYVRLITYTLACYAAKSQISRIRVALIRRRPGKSLGSISI